MAKETREKSFPAPTMTDDFFRSRLEQMIDLKHPLVVLTSRLPWAQIEAALAPSFARKSRDGKVIEGSDLFGSAMEIAGGVSAAGRPRLSIRLMASLQYLKRAYNLSDEEVAERWAENVVWQYFSGQTYYEPKLPCDPTQLGRFRTAIGEAGVEELLKATIDTVVTTKAVLPAEIEQVIVELGYLGVDKDNPDVETIDRSKYKSLTQQQLRRLKRRQAIDPTIGNLKSDHRMARCWLLRAMVRLGLKVLLLRPIFLLLQAAILRTDVLAMFHRQSFANRMTASQPCALLPSI
jgi:hypothetical protein